MRKMQTPLPRRVSSSVAQRNKHVEFTDDDIEKAVEEKISPLKLEIKTMLNEHIASVSNIMDTSRNNEETISKKKYVELLEKYLNLKDTYLREWNNHMELIYNYQYLVSKLSMHLSMHTNSADKEDTIKMHSLILGEDESDTGEPTYKSYTEKKPKIITNPVVKRRNSNPISRNKQVINELDDTLSSIVNLK